MFLHPFSVLFSPTTFPADLMPALMDAILIY